MNLGDTIKMMRKERRITQKKLAEDIGISDTALYNIEKNKSFPPKETISKICKGLGVPVAHLMISCLTEEDVPPEKREAFNLLIPLVKEALFGQKVTK